MTENLFNQPDAADRARAIRESIAAKQAKRPKVDAQGHRIGEPVTYEYDAHGNLIGPIPPDAA